jgi:hypothetical protein
MKSIAYGGILLFLSLSLALPSRPAFASPKPC